MKKATLVIAAALFLISGSLAAQDISQSQVPSVILNNFQKAYPKASDVEWEMKGNLYNVEFETGLHTDHEIWYDGEGKTVRHKEDITRNQLPAAVTSSVKQQFKGYRISDPKRITTSSEVTYTMELKSLTREWEISVDSTGKILKQHVD